MNSRIQNLVSLYFEGIPFSAQTWQAQQRILSALEEQLVRLEPQMGQEAAFEQLVQQYPKLADMAVLAGYAPEEAENWRQKDQAKSLPLVKKQLTRQRWRIYGAALLWALASVQLLWMVYNLLNHGANYALFNSILMTALAAVGAVLLRRFRQTEQQTADWSYDTSAFLYLRQLRDRYQKRLLNSLPLSAWMLTLFTLSALAFLQYGPSKPQEQAETIFSNIFLVEIPFFLLVKNYFCLYLANHRIHSLQRDTGKKHLQGMALLATVYWLASCLPVCLGWNTMTVFLPASLITALLVMLYNLTLRRRIVEQNIVLNKRRAAVLTSGALLLFGFYFLQRNTWYTQPYINSVPVVPHRGHQIDYDDQTGIYTITANTEDFKILHLTDIHLGGSLFSYRKDLKALQAVYLELTATQPDLVIVTGDLCFPLGIMSFSLNNFAPVNQFAAMMRNTGIPWAFTYGNHDTESLASLSQTGLNEAYKALSYKTSANLLYPYVQPEITGRNNQLIELRNEQGELIYALFLIDSNAYTGEGINVYDYIHDDQVEWYANHVQRLQQQAGYPVPSLAFFHIPLQQYRQAYQLYLAGSDAVTYFFGENNEKMMDVVCCSDYPSKLFDTIVELGSTKALFCGHDHYNNMSLEYRGIRLTYGMSIDYLAMPGIEKDLDQRGGELITLYPDGQFDIRQIPLESIR